MGGCGSGNRSQHGRRTVESCPSIDVRQWQRAGWFAECGSIWPWHLNGRLVRSMWVTVNPEYLTLDYECVWSNALPERLRYHVPLARTACNYGGARYWFVCPMPGCPRRAAILYLVGGRFACRHCQHLAYRTQHENFYGRGLLKAQSIREKLGGSANMTLPFPPKPKHMHWRKYYRLKTAAQDGETRSMVGLQAWLDSMKRA